LVGTLSRWPHAQTPWPHHKWTWGCGWDPPAHVGKHSPVYRTEGKGGRRGRGGGGEGKERGGEEKEGGGRRGEGRKERGGEEGEGAGEEGKKGRGRGREGKKSILRSTPACTTSIFIAKIH